VQSCYYLEQCHYSVMHGLTFLLRGIGCVSLVLDRDDGGQQAPRLDQSNHARCADTASVRFVLSVRGPIHLLIWLVRVSVVGLYLTDE